jgi:hypothetical protein
MNEENKYKVLVATPMYGGMCNGAYALGLLNMPGVFANAGVSMMYTYMMNESLITRARNNLANDFMDTECTHLMFIDADIGFNPQDIVPMIHADKDIICGLYPKKEINWVQVEEAVKAGVPTEKLKDHTGIFVVNAVNYEKEIHGNVSDVMEIANGGTGFMLIKREVLIGLADKVPEYINDMFAVTDDHTKKRVIKEYFATSIDTTSGNRLLSEDYHFCKIAREAGYKIWAAPWAQLSHTGSYVFSGYLPRV